MNLEASAEVVAASAGAEYDCRRCGACCLTTAPHPGYVTVRDDESLSLKALGLPVISDSLGTQRLGTVNHASGRQACCALEGESGIHCTCTIYEARPNVCREFATGTQACHHARLHAGLSI